MNKIKMSSWLQFANIQEHLWNTKEGRIVELFEYIEKNEHFVWSARVSIVFKKKKRKYVNISKTFCEIGPYTVSIDLKKKKHWETARASL